MYGQTEDQEKQKKKIIIVSLVMGIIIIVLIGILINAITSKNKNAQVASTDTSVVRDDEKSAPTAQKIEENTKSETAEQKAEDTKLEPVANSSTSTNTSTTTTTNTTNKSNLPQTGPESIIGLALLAGSATTYVFSKRK